MWMPFTFINIFFNILSLIPPNVEHNRKHLQWPFVSDQKVHTQHLMTVNRTCYSMCVIYRENPPPLLMHVKHWKAVLQSLYENHYYFQLWMETITECFLPIEPHTHTPTESQTFKPVLNHTPEIKDTLLAWGEGGQSSSFSLLLSSFTSSSPLHQGALFTEPEPVSTALLLTVPSTTIQE